MRLVKRFMPAALLAVSMLSINVGASAESVQGKRLANLTLPTSNPFLAKLTETIQAEAKQHGMEVTVFSSPYDAALQSQQINDAISQSFDALLITAASERGIIPALMAAQRAEIPVFLINSPIADGNEALYVTYVGEDHAKLGRAAGGALVEALKGRNGAKVAAITGSLAEGVAPRRIAGFKEVVEKHPEIDLVAVEDAKWDTATSERVAGQLFARFAAQGGLDGIYGMADNIAHGAIMAAKAADMPLGVKDGETVVVSSNCMKFGIEHIRNGAQYSTATQMPTRTGKATVDAVVAHFQGKDLPKNSELEAVAITKANLDEYAEACTF